MFVAQAGQCDAGVAWLSAVRNEEFVLLCRSEGEAGVAGLPCGC